MDASNKHVGRMCMNRRGFLRLTTAAGGAALLAACGAPPATEPVAQATTAPEAPPPTAAPPTAAPPTEVAAEAPTTAPEAPAPTEAPADNRAAVTIDWWNPFQPESGNAEAMPRVTKAFQELYPWITVEYELIGGPPGGGDFLESLLARIAAGNPPETCTLWSPPSQFAARGSLTAIDEYMIDARWATRDAFYAGPLNTCAWRGKLYGLPASAGAGSFYINVDQFNAKGISPKREDFPKTWDDLKALSAEFVVWEGDQLKTAGLVPWAESWLKPVWSGLNGGKFYDGENERYTIDSEENIELLAYWVQWLDDQYKGDLEHLNLFGNWDGVGNESAFGQGIAPIAMGGSWSPQSADFQFAWDVTKFAVGPRGTKSVTGYWPNWWAIPTGAKHLEEDFLFCEFWCTKGWEIRYLDVMDTPAWKGFSPDILTKSLVDQFGEARARDINQFFADYLLDTVEMWNSPVEDFASQTLDTAIQEVMSKAQAPADALKQAQELMQAKLEEVISQA